MSDNDDLLGDDLGDQSLADYNLGNEEEEQLLADDYESGSSQNVPASVGPSYRGGPDLVSDEYPGHGMNYSAQQISYQPLAEPECVVPNITVEIPNVPIPDHSTYAPYEPPVYEVEHAVVPPAIPAAPLEPSQIVPSDIPLNVSNGEVNIPRERFTSERAPGSQRLPQIRDIPDSLDKVVIPRGGFGSRGRTSWRNPQLPRHQHPYRRHNVHRGNFNQRQSFPPPHLRPSPPQMRPEIRQEIRHEMRPDILPEMHSEMRPDMRPDIHPDMRQDGRPDMRQDGRPDMRQDGRPDMRQDGRPDMRQDGRPDMRQDGRPDMRQDGRPDMRQDGRPDMRQDGRPDMRQDGRPDMRQDGRPDMRQDGRPDMRPDDRPDMRSDLRPDMRPDGRLDMRPDGHPDMRPEMRHDIRPDMRPDFPPDIRPDFPPDMRPELRHEPPPRMPHQMGPEISPERPLMPDFRQEIRPFDPRFQFRPNMDEPRFRPNFEPRPMFFRPNFNQRPFGPPVREMMPNNCTHMPQVMLRQPLPKSDKLLPKPRQQEVIMLPVQLPALAGGGLAGKKVLINPHFKGNFQPTVEGLPAYIPTRIQKTPPLSPTLESKLGPVKDIDDAAERFIAEQRNALARAANRKIVRRSPQRFIENTTIEIENDLMGGAAPPRRDTDDELLRRQEQFISANMAGLRRRMRSPSPIRRSPSPRRSPERFERPERAERERERERRHRPDAAPAPAPRTNDEESEYRRRVREQENLRSRVLRAKEVRRRKNAAALHKLLQDRDRERLEKESKVEPTIPPPERQADKQTNMPPVAEYDNQPDTTRKSPEKTAKVEKNDKAEKVEKVRDRSPIKDDSAEVNSTCENLTPPRPPSPERALTPPLPRTDSDDDLDLILGDIDGILSDDDDSGRFKEKQPKPEPVKPAGRDLRARIGARGGGGGGGAGGGGGGASGAGEGGGERRQRQKIVFHDDKEDKKKRDKSPPRRAVVTSSTKTDNSENSHKRNKQVSDASTNKSRQRIIFDNKEEKQKEKDKDDDKKQSFSNRRVILQRKISQTTKEPSKSVFSRIETKNDPTKPNPGIFSRAVRTAIGSEKTRIVIKKLEEPQVEFESDSDLDEDKLLEEEIGNVAEVSNLPHGMTDTRLKTLAGDDVQSLSLDKEERSAKITFKTTVAAEHFKRKFNNKMVAASRLTVSLR